MAFQRIASRFQRRLLRILRASWTGESRTSEARGRERYRRAGLTAASGIGGRGFTMALSLLTVPLTLTYLGPERYGMWLTISSMVALLTFTDLGIGNGLLNAATHAIARGEFVHARRQISSALALLTVLVAALAGLFVFLYPILPWTDVLAVSSPQAISEAGPAVAVFMICFLLGIPLSIIAQVRFARQEGYLVHLSAAAGNLAALVTLLAVIVSRQGLPLLVAAMAGPPLIASALNGLVLFTHSAPELRPSLGLADRITALRLLRAGFLFFVLQLAIAVAFTSDTLVVAQLIGPEAVATYGVTSKLFVIPIGIAAASLAPLWPAYGEAIALGDISWARSTLKRSIKVGLISTVPTVAVLVAFGLPIIGLWVGTSVTPPFLLLLGFGIWVVLSTVGNAVAMLLNGANELRFQAGAAAVMAIMNVTVSIWLTSRIGVAGVVWGTVITYGVFILGPMAFYVPGVLQRIERTPLSIKPNVSVDPV